MFTGIVTDVGQVRHIEKRGDTHIVIVPHYDMDKLPMGGSVACCGACLTIVDKGSNADKWFAVTASAETLSKTTMGTWKVGSPVNLELPLKVGDELGGHIVSGHVDGLAELVKLYPEGESTRMVFDAPKALARFIAEKGSVALDGISLTVNEVENNRFGINVIPHTLAVTTFGHLQPGMKVNIEIDTIARYVARLVKG
jgi:riboflavin synthase